jgi:hypothetical protein
MRANYAPPAELGGIQTKALIVGFIGLLVFAVGGYVVGSMQLVLQSYLVAYIFWLGISLSCLGLLMIQYLGGAGWGLLIRRILESGAYTLLLMAIGFIVVVVGMLKFGLYEWVHPPDKIAALVAKKTWWLTPTKFIVRGVIYFAIWIGFMWYLRANSHKQDETGDPKLIERSQYWSGLGFFLFALALTFAAIDWVMSLDAEWFSTIFGMLMLAGWGVTTIAVIIWVCVTLAKRDGYDQVYKPKLFHDLGKLQLALVMIWSYFSFSQLLIIWAGNLPEEIPWYLERFDGIWRYIGIGLILLHFVMPFLLLLSRDLKRHANRLKWVALLLILMRFTDLLWVMVPEFQNRHGKTHNHSITGLWVYVAALLGIGGFWLWWFLGHLRKRSLLPVNDPQLAEALAAGGHH